MSSFKKSKVKNKTGVIKAIILAAGYSKRINLGLPKQLIRINNKPLLAYTLDVFERCRRIESIILVAPPKFIDKYRSLIKQYGYKKIEQLCLGGRRRQQSVFNALKRIKDCDYVVIHDGVRPFVTEAIILRTIKAVERFNAVTCAVKTIDTIVEANKDFVGTFLCRDKLWNIQTPQAFEFNLIFKAHQQARRTKTFSASDDAQLLLGLKKEVKLIEGSYQNIKVTTISDLLMFKKLKENSV